MKKLFVFILAFICLSASYAQQQQMPTIPNDPQVKVGKLDNGLTYYIRQNALPKERAEFYIAQNVGAVLEQPNQRGLAHFLEHMAFNGTKHFPDKNLLNYLETIGVKFGENLNAYTSIENTVFMMSSVPVARETVIDSCLLILRDWSDGITLSDTEIEKERGVIEEEWRTSSGPWLRTAEKILPKIYGTDKYADCLPIGSIDVIRNFKGKELRDYYSQWYRPDLQAIIIIGDIDPSKVETKIKEIFGSVVMPKNAPKKIEYPVSDNKNPIVALAKDKEATNVSVEISYKHDVFPKEMKGTVAYMLQQFANNAVSKMMEARFDELIQKPNPPFVNASAEDGSFWVSSTKDAWDLYAIASDKGASEAIKALLTENERMKRYGFTAGEYERAKAEIMKGIEKQYNERDKQLNNYYVFKYVNNFTNNEPIPSIEYTLQTYTQLSQRLPLEIINNMVMQPTDTSNLVIVIKGPDKGDMVYPSENEVVKTVQEIKNATIEPYKETVSNEPLVGKLPKQGRIKSEKALSEGITEFILSNGVKVLVKPTTLKDDEVQFLAYSQGGNSLVDKKDATTLKVLEDLSEISGLGNYNATDLQKVLAGKNVRMNKSLNTYSESLRGQSGKKDIESLFQLAYLEFTGIRTDEEAFQSFMKKQEAILKNQEANPTITLIDSLNATLYNNNPRATRLSTKDLSQVNYTRAIEILKGRYANAADFTFVILGNVNTDSIKPLLTKYISTLPASKKKETWKDADLVIKNGNKTIHYSKVMETPKATCVQYHSGNIPYTLENRLKMSILNQILDIIYTEKVREEQGGTYGVSVSGWLDALPYNRFTMEIYFDTDPEKKDMLIGIVNREFKSIAENGPRPQDLQKVKEFIQKQYNDNLIENSYWLGVMEEKIITGLDIHTNYLTILNSIDEESIKQFAIDLQKADNLKEIVQIGTK